MADGNEPQPLGVSGIIVPDPTNYPYVKCITYGKLAVITASVTVSGGGGAYIEINGFPKAQIYSAVPLVNDTGYADINADGKFGIRSNTSGTHFAYCVLVYIMAD